jgi:hypothetical protein
MADEQRTFLSWYNGWGTHSVWGAGRVAGSYENAAVKCGNAQIKVKAIYDSHASADRPPTEKQTSAFARSHNVALVRELTSKGIQCAFEKEAKGK